MWGTESPLCGGQRARYVGDRKPAMWGTEGPLCGGQSPLFGGRARTEFVPSVAVRSDVALVAVVLALILRLDTEGVHRGGECLLEAHVRRATTALQTRLEDTVCAVRLSDDERERDEEEDAGLRREERSRG